MFKVLQQKRAHAVSAGTACLVSSAFPCWAATTCCASQALTDRVHRGQFVQHRDEDLTGIIL